MIIEATTVEKYSCLERLIQIIEIQKKKEMNKKVVTMKEEERNKEMKNGSKKYPKRMNHKI